MEDEKINKSDVIDLLSKLPRKGLIGRNLLDDDDIIYDEGVIWPNQLMFSDRNGCVVKWEDIEKLIKELKE